MGEVDKLRRDLQQSQARIAHLEQLADQDPLTPVANRRAFVRELTRMMAFADRYDAVSSLIYFDLNGLKPVNDSYGHAAGDAVIAYVARVLVQNVRDSDVVGRLGGDELGVLLAYTDEVGAHEKATALAAAVAAEPVDWNGVMIPTSVSWGLHTFRNGDKAHEALDAAAQAIDAADRAMYAKRRSARSSSRSGDDVGEQVALDLQDGVLELQLALLQPLDLQLVERLLLGQPRDHVVEIAVLGLEFDELAPQRLVLGIVHCLNCIRSATSGEAARTFADSA